MIQTTRMPRKVLEALKEARQAATMEAASFGFPNDTVTASMHMEGTKTMHPDEFIKGETRLYRQSWIISPLDRVIAWAEGK
jgi:hypothetical protein